MVARPNVLLLTVDSLRADAVGDPAIETPAWDRLAEAGVTYERAFAQGPFTTFSMPSLFTSRYPSALEYVEFSDQTVGVAIGDAPTLPETLQAAGYQTAGFHSNPLLSNLFGFDRGFDTFDARLPFAGTDRLPGRLKILADKVRRLVRTHAYLPAGSLVERAVDWLDDRAADRPFFLWLHFMDVHGPYQAKRGNAYLNKFRGERLWRKAQTSPDELTSAERRRLRSLYDGEIEYTEACIDDLLEELATRDLLSETVTVLTADHGEAFYEHGTYSHPHQLYDELTHVPLVVRDPDGPSDSRSAITELLDVAPTIVDRVDATVPEAFAGRSLFADRSGESEPDAISEADLTPAYVGSVRTDRWRYIRDDVAGEELLFDHASDPGEHENVAADNRDVTSRLADRLEGHLAVDSRAVGSDREVATAEVRDADVQARLEDLGYLE